MPLGKNNQEKTPEQSRRVRRTGALKTLLTFIVIVLGVLFAMSVFFKVAHIEVSGNSYYTEEEITQASGIETGDNLFFVNRFTAVSRIFAKLPYVQKVTIDRKLPNTVVIDVTESQKLAYIAAEDVYWALDSNCKVLEQIDTEEAQSLIRIDGIEVTAAEVGSVVQTDAVDAEKVTFLAAILGEIQDRQMMADITYIDMDNVTNPSFDYLGRFTVKLGTNENIEYKFGLLTSAVEKLEQGDYGTIDLSVDNQAHYSPN